MHWRTTNLPRLIRRVTARRTVRRPSVLFAVLLLVGLLFGAVPAAGQGPDRGPSIEPADLPPDLTLVVGRPIEDPDRLVRQLTEIEGVTRVAIDATASPDPLVHLSVTPAAEGRLDGVVERSRLVIGDGDQEAVSVLAGGSAVTDRALVERFGRSAGWLVWLAAAIGLAIGLLGGEADRWKRGLVAAVGLALAVLAAGTIGDQVAGPFLGTMAGTGLPAALAGLVIAVALTARLLVWFRTPSGADGAAQIQRAVADLGPELILLFAGLFATSLIVEPLDPGRSAITVASIGAAVAAVVTIAVVAPALVVIGPPAAEAGPSHLPISVPDGRDLSLPVVALAGLTLAILTVAALGQVDGDLLDGTDLDPEGDAARVAAAQAAQGGDPTQGFAVTGGTAATVDLAGWVAAAAERPDVAWIDFEGQRYTSTGPAVVDSWAVLAPEGTATAVVVPSTNLRGVEGRALIEGLEAIPLAGDGPRFEGGAADIGGAAGSRGTVLVAIALLGLASALATFVLTSNRALAAVSLLLRLLVGGATVGLHNLVATDPSMASILTALAVVTVGSSMSELELLRRLERDWDTSPDRNTGTRPPVPGPLASNPGQFGAIGLASLVLVAPVLLIVAMADGGPGTVRLAFALLLAALVDIGVAAAVLRPALLGQRSAFQTAARPLRVAVHGRSTGDPATDTPPDDDPTWREVVIDLIQTEFWLQTEPETAELGLVFEGDTPVHRQAAERHANLASSGLRVVGRPPELVSLRTVRDRQPVIVTVTVDHPASQLLDQEGHVVGVRRPERRIGRLWLSADPVEGHRIVESIEMGSNPLPDDEAEPQADEDERVPPDRVMAEDQTG